MKWIDDPPEDWESAPESPPDGEGIDVEIEPYAEGVIVHEVGPEASSAYIYVREGEQSLEELA